VFKGLEIMENENLVDDILVESDIGFITSQDIEKSINDFENSLSDPGILYINGHKSFNLLLRYLYKHNIVNVIDTSKYNYDYDVLNQIFINIYIPLTYKYNRIASVNNFSVLVNIDYSLFYDIKTGVYRSNDGNVNDIHSRIIQKWISICNGELIDNVMHTGNVGGMFVAKTRGFREEPQTVVMIDTHAPKIDAKQIGDMLGKLPELPE
jgi:hypothetical protein